MPHCTSLLSEIEVQLGRKDASHNCFQNEMFCELMESKVVHSERGFRDLAAELEIRLRVLKCGIKELAKGRRTFTTGKETLSNPDKDDDEGEEPLESIEDIKFACSAAARLRCGNVPSTLVDLFSRKISVGKSRPVEKERSDIEWAAATNLPDAAWAAKQHNYNRHSIQTTLFDDTLNEKLSAIMNQKEEQYDWDQISQQVITNEGIDADKSYERMLGISLQGGINKVPKKTVFSSYCPPAMLEERKQQEPVTAESFLQNTDSEQPTEEQSDLCKQYTRAGGVFSTYSSIPPMAVPFPEDKVRSRLNERKVARAAKKALQTRRDTKTVTQTERVLSVLTPVISDVPTSSKSGRVRLKQSPVDNCINYITAPIDSSIRNINNQIDCNINYNNFTELYSYNELQHNNNYELLVDVKQLREAMSKEDTKYLIGSFVPDDTIVNNEEIEEEVVDVLVDDDECEAVAEYPSQTNKRKWLELSDQLRDSIQKIVKVNRRYSISKISGILTKLLNNSSSNTSLTAVHEFAQRQDPTVTVTPQLIFTAIVHHAHHNNYDGKHAPIKLTSGDQGTDVRIIKVDENQE